MRIFLGPLNKFRWINAELFGSIKNLPMRPITKIFLLIVVAFFVYLLWPREPKMTEFSPPELARLRVDSWQKEGKGGLGLLFTDFRIFAFQFGFSPLASFQIASNEASAVSTLHKYADDPEGSGETRALVSLQEKYVLIKRQTKMDFDTDACARSEIAWRTIELDGGRPEAVARGMAGAYAALYGGDAGEYLDATRNLAGARVLLAGAALPEGYTNAKRAALELATDGFTDLRAILSKSREVTSE